MATTDIEITNGPSKLDLMLATFDTDSHPCVTFTVLDWNGENPTKTHVQIIKIGRKFGYDETWIIEVQEKDYRVLSVEYRTDNRSGTFHVISD